MGHLHLDEAVVYDGVYEEKREGGTYSFAVIYE